MDRGATIATETTERHTEPSGHASVCAIINTRAGTALDLPPEKIGSALVRAFGRQGQGVSVIFAAPEDIESEIKRVAQRPVDVLVVGGGDGTVRTAAHHLLGSKIALGILPLGTLNRLAKDLEIPHNLEQAAEFLAKARPTKIDVAKVNETIFLCNSLMGATLRFSEGRARLRGLPAHERIPKYLSLITDVMSSRRKISIEVDGDTEHMRTRALSVAVTNNGYDETLSGLRRSRLDGGKLTMYVSQHRSGWGLAMALTRALLGLWRGDPDVTKLVGTRFVVRSPKRHRQLSNDGEVGKYDTPLVYEVMPKCLTVLMAADDARVARG